MLAKLTQRVEAAKLVAGAIITIILGTVTFLTFFDSRMEALAFSRSEGEQLAARVTIVEPKVDQLADQEQRNSEALNRIEGKLEILIKRTK